MRLAVAALLLAAMGAGCGVGGPCRYEEARGTVEVTSVEPSGQGGCNRVAYRWLTGGPSRHPNFDVLVLVEDCAVPISVGTAFEVERQDMVTGTCTPSMHSALDPEIEACRCR
jgi:hypothetical protein